MSFQTSTGEERPEGTHDAQAIAYHVPTDTLYWADQYKGAISQMNLDGSFIREMTIPDNHRREETAEATRGLRSDCGYQGLTISPDDKLYVVTGCPLIQNSEVVTNSDQEYSPEGGYAVTMLVYDISGSFLQLIPVVILYHQSTRCGWNSQAGCQPYP